MTWGFVYKSSCHFEKNLPTSYTFIKDIVLSGVKQVFVTGTCFEYGLQNGGISSDQPTYPVNSYGFAKDC